MSIYTRTMAILCMTLTTSDASEWRKCTVIMKIMPALIMTLAKIKALTDIIDMTRKNIIMITAAQHDS